MLLEPYILTLTRTAASLDAVAALYRCGFSLPTAPVEFRGMYFRKYSDREGHRQACLGWCPQQGFVQLILPQPDFATPLDRV